MTDERINEINEMSIEQLKQESNSVYGSICNEKTWMFGSLGNPEAEQLHSDNVDELRVELRYIDDLVKEKESVDAANGEH